MQIKVTQLWDEAHWSEHALTLTPQQQQQVEAYILANPEYNEEDLLDLLGLSYTDITHNGELTDEGYKANNDEYEVEIDDQASVEVVK